MDARSPRVLLVEDDKTLRESITLALEGEGYQVLALPDGMAARQSIDSFRPDLALLDVRLPAGPSGLSLARLLRQDVDAPVLLVTAADAVDDRLAGFDAGADDYLVKPFVMEELLARIRALLRRSGRLTSTSWQVGDLIVDETSRTVIRDGLPIELTKTEFDLLLALGRNPGKVLSKSQLLSAVWGFDAYDPNLVEVHISALRRKLEAHGGRLVHTVRGSGYRLQA